MKVIAEKMLPARLLCRLIPRVVPRTSTACLSTIPEPELKPLYLDAQVDLPPHHPFLSCGPYFMDETFRYGCERELNSKQII